VHAAVVELDALADAIRTGAEDDHAAPVAGVGLVARPVTARGALRGHPASSRTLPPGVEVRRARLELGGAGVDRLERSLEVLLRVLAAGERGQLGEEPRVDTGAPVQLLLGHALAHRVEQQLEAIVRGL